MGKLTELIERLEAASEGSRPLDWLIAEELGDEAFRLKAAAWPPFAPGSKIDKDIPAFTTSLDAIVALIDRKLTGWIIERIGEHVFADHRAKGPFMATLRTSPVLTGLTFAQCHYARSRPLALCIAFLRALQAQQETSEDE